MSEPRNGADVLAKIVPTRREGRTQICLRPDLVDDHERATIKLAEVQAATARRGRIGSSVEANDEATALADQIGELENQIEAASVWFHFRALTSPEWEALCDSHPPRERNMTDLYAGYNVRDVEAALVRKSLIDPVFDDQSWADLQPQLAPGEADELRRCAREVNGRTDTNPFSETASRIRAARGSDDARRAHGE